MVGVYPDHDFRSRYNERFDFDLESAGYTLCLLCFCFLFLVYFLFFLFFCSESDFSMRFLVDLVFFYVVPRHSLDWSSVELAKFAADKI